MIEAGVPATTPLAPSAAPLAVLPAMADSSAAPWGSMDHDSRLVRRWFALSMGALLMAYALLMNPYWVPGGDSDFYVSIARNLVLTGEYTYNGLPVAISPPGWPRVMAWVMMISPTFFALKLTTMLGMLASLGVSYFILLRFAPPRVAALTVMLTGILMPVYSLTYFLHSEAIYCLISAAALLLAMRIREARGRYVEQALLILLCIVIPCIRWAGIVQLLPIAAVLLSGQWGQWRERRWVLALTCTIVIIALSFGTRSALELTAEQKIAIKEAGGAAATETDSEENTDDLKAPPLAPGASKEGESRAEEYGQRFLRIGKWFTWLLWYPARFAAVSRPIDTTLTVVGWGVVAVLGYLVVNRTRRGDLLWLATALYCGALCMNWPNPNARYFVPVAPLIVGGVLLALRQAGVDYPATSADWWKWARRAFVYSLLLCNLAMYGVDVIVMRSSNFYATFEAGQHKDLINVTRYLDSLAPMPPDVTTGPQGVQYRPENGDVVVNKRYENIGRIRYSEAGMRAMVLLSNRHIKSLGDNKRFTSQLGPNFSAPYMREIRRLRSEWVLIQSPSVPWRVWHFRLPRPVYERLAKNPSSQTSGGWTLYHFNPDTLTMTEQPVPPVEDWPTRVPGM
ncbi:MAG TPA: hypothetical protein VGB55_10610 [Tepidisphaeraceae bacterium]|jgi:hypothetical protein